MAYWRRDTHGVDDRRPGFWEWLIAPLCASVIMKGTYGVFTHDFYPQLNPNTLSACLASPHLNTPRQKSSFRGAVWRNQHPSQLTQIQSFPKTHLFYFSHLYCYFSLLHLLLHPQTHLHHQHLSVYWSCGLPFEEV